MIVIIDTGVANLYSVKNALDHLGVENSISSDPEILAKADKLIFPGVGAFSAGMKSITEKGLVSPLNELILEDKKPILGICLGFQMFAESSSEQGRHKGLGWIPGEIKHLSNITDEKIPHIGFNDITYNNNSKLFTNIKQSSDFYFVHSFYLDTDPSYVSASVTYVQPFAVAIEYKNIMGVQFHPEKSKNTGLILLNNFCSRRFDA
ncbi:imidazole glycerol phosphate synthase subunit HisH [Kiloniella litopenaei]|uniref:imidazole glycerol phosphate synthase subunit HisH n=1 Tax=Kiloniella litopenaei TaxID=1549748 RepID=UPI003BAAAFB9